MHHDTALLYTLVGAMVAALAGGLIAHRLGLSPIVGYLIAGLAVGPFTPGFDADAGIAASLAEVGIILLMFGVGLHFHLDDLLAVWKVAVPGALLQTGFTALLGAGAASLFGWPLAKGLTYGLCIAVASTVVLTKMVTEEGEQHSRLGHIAIGWLLVEDLLTVLMLVMLPVMAGDQAASASDIVQAAAWTLLKLAGLLIVTMWFGRRIIVALLAYAARTRSRELFTLTVLALAVGIALGSAKLFGASMELGAFVAGMVVGQSTYAARAAAEALPMRDAFAVLFFVSIGMQFDPQAVLTGWQLILITLAIILVGKPIAAWTVMHLLKQARRDTFGVSAVLSQIGEFSFLLANAGLAHGVMTSQTQGALVIASVISIALNRGFFRLALKRAEALDSAGQSAAPAAPLPKPPDQQRAIVVGFGPVGRALTRTLRNEGLDVVVVERNPDTVTALEAQGQRAVYGTASQTGILEHAGAEQASALFFTADAPPDAEAIARAREHNPRLRVTARARYTADVQAWRSAGANHVVTAEVEVALAMSEYLLSALGASPETIDRERARLRADLGGQRPPEGLGPRDDETEPGQPLR